MRFGNFVTAPPSRSRSLVLAAAAVPLLFLSLTTARADSLYVSNIDNNSIAVLASNGSPSIFTNSGLNEPVGLAFDSAGNLYASNFAGNYITKITPDHVQTIFLDNSMLLDPTLKLDNPTGLAFDKSGNLYIANYGSNTIIQLSGGVASRYYSTGLNGPNGIAFNAAGRLYVANQGSGSIEEIISAGSGNPYYNNLSAPFGVTFDASGNLYVANINSNSIEKITGLGAGSHYIATGLDAPTGVAFDAAGNLYVANAGNNTIDEFTPGGVEIPFASLQSIDGTDSLDQPRLLAFGPNPLSIAVPLPAAVWHGFLILGLCGGYQLMRRRASKITVPFSS